MNTAPFRITIISLVITFLIIWVGSLPEIQNSFAAISSNIDNTLIQPVSEVNKTTEGVEEVKVNRVIDGDTIVLEDGRTIRYLNMDTPETKKPATPVMCYGVEASKYNETSVSGRRILIKPEKEDKDRYGRSLRFIFFVGADTSSIANSLNAKMVKEGYARSSIYKPNDTYADYFNKLEAEAKKAKIGVWGNCDKPFVE
jgi:micrococcal nuclease